MEIGFLGGFSSCHSKYLRDVSHNDLSTFATDTASQLDVFGHNGDAFGVNGAQVGVFEETNQVSLGSFLKENPSNFNLPNMYVKLFYIPARLRWRPIGTANRS